MEAIGNGIKVAKKKHWFLRTIRLKRTWLIVILLLVGAGITFSILNKKIVTVYTTESVKRGELVQTVTATGNVESAKEIDLSFKIPGQIGAVNIKAGDMVVAGQILASIDNTAYLSQVAQLTAAVAVANANLERVQAGASKEDVKITQEQVVKAQADLANLQIDRDVQLTSLREKSLDTLNNSVFTAKVVLNKIYNYFINRDTTTGLQVSDTDLKNQVLNAYLLRVNDLEDAHKVVTTANLVKTNDNILNAISSLRSVLSNINLLLTDSYSLAEAIIVNANYPQAIKDTIKADISTQQATNSASSANIQLARSNLTSSVSNYSSQIAAAQNSLSIYQAQLDLKQSGPRSFEVQSALASLSQAKAQLAKAQLDLQDYNLIAPISGIVTKVNINKGEQSSVALVAVKILTVENYQVKVDVPESDIAKIKVGDKVSVQLDAFGSDHIFSGSISFIEPAQTVIQDVIYYKTTVVFDQDSWSNRLRSGMTADVIVSTAKKQDALYIPSKAIKIKEGIIDKKITRVVEVLQPLDKVEEKIIETGIRADGGLVEVLSGLNEGENVVIFKKTSTN